MDRYSRSRAGHYFLGRPGRRLVCVEPCQDPRADLSAQTQQFTQFKQSDDVLGQRLAKAEDANAQLQGELAVVTDKMKLTQDELGRARYQAKKIREDETKQLADLQTNVAGQLATKASVDDVSKIGTDVNGVRPTWRTPRTI